VESADIRHLCIAARKSADGTALDEMVRVVYKPLVNATFENIADAKNIVYADFKDLPTLLGKGTLLRVEAAEFVPRPVHSAEAVKEVSEQPQAVQADAPVDGPITGAQEVDLVNISQVDTIPEEEYRAAGKIQEIYRQHLLKKAPSSESTLASSRRTFFEQLAQEQGTIPAEKTLYRKMFLGPLAHALLCADHVQRWVYNLKRKAKRQLSSLKHQDLEDIRARQTKSTSFKL
jgi:hypothetical protein